MSDTATRSWVWHSTPASRAEGKTSLLALLETTLCVAAYWALWKWLGVTWHHWLIVIATPLVLLRSEQSVKLGAKWFDQGYWAKDAYPFRESLALLIGAACGLWLAWQLHITEYCDASSPFQFGEAVFGWWLRLSASLAVIAFVLSPDSERAAARALTVVFATAVMTLAVASLLGLLQPCGLAIASFAIAALPFGVFILVSNRVNAPILRVIMGPLISVGIAAGIGLSALAARMFATLRHPVAGIKALPTNWVYALSIADFAQPPELVPGSVSVIYKDDLSLSLRQSNGDRRTKEDIWFATYFVPLIFLPAILWRWSIKSTAWFYLPLAFVARYTMAETDTARASYAKAYSRKLINILFLLLAIISLATAATAMVRPDWLALMLAKTAVAGAPVPPLGYLLVLDWSRIADQPWQWAYLPSATLSVLLFFLYDNIGRNIEHGIPEARYYPRLRLMQRAANASLVLTLAGLGTALWYFARAMWSWDQLQAGLFRWL